MAMQTQLTCTQIFRVWYNYNCTMPVSQVDTDVVQQFLISSFTCTRLWVHHAKATHSALYSTIQHYTALYSTIQHYTALYSTIQHYTVLYSIIQHYTALYSTIQHYTALYSIQHYTAFSTIQHSALYSPDSTKKWAKGAHFFNNFFLEIKLVMHCFSFCVTHSFSIVSKVHCEKYLFWKQTRC